MPYRVWSAINKPGGIPLAESEREFVDVSSPMHGYEVIEGLREQYATDSGVPTCAFGLEHLCMGRWREWYDSGGLDVVERFGERRASVHEPRVLQVQRA